MIRKVFFALWIIGLVFVVSALIYINIPGDTGLGYSSNPVTWVNEKPDNIKEVDFDKVTEGKSYFDKIDQQYVDEEKNIITAFGYDGIYYGEVFRTEFFDENNNLKLQITPELNPADGVPQAIIIEKIENNVPFAYIFVDRDWKELIGESYIAWGAEYQNVERFAYDEIKTGVYMNKVEDDINRFTKEDFSGLTYGGVSIGTFTKEDIVQGNIDGIAIMLH